MRKDFHRNDGMGQNTTPNDGDPGYPRGSPEILSCNFEVLICQTLHVAKNLPKDMYESNKYIHEISIAKWEACLDIYTASLCSSSSDTLRSSGVGHASVAQQRKVCEKAQDPIGWNMRVEALNSIITHNHPMTKKLRIGNRKRLQRNFEAARKDQSEITATSGSGREDIRETSEDILIPRSSELNIRETTSKHNAEDAQQSLNGLAVSSCHFPSWLQYSLPMGQDIAAGMRLFYVYWVISLGCHCYYICWFYKTSFPSTAEARLHGWSQSAPSAAPLDNWVLMPLFRDTDSVISGVWVSWICYG